MSPDAEFKEKLRRSLARVLVQPDIQVAYAGWGDVGWSEGARALVSVVSPTFENMDEGRRQEVVRSRLLDEDEGIDRDDRVRIDYIYTDAPSELDADDPRRPSAGAVAGPNPNG